MAKPPTNPKPRETATLRARVRALEAERADSLRVSGALRDGELLFRTTFDCSPVPSFLVAMDGHFLSVNEALCRLTGHTAEDLLQKIYLDLAHSSEHPDCLKTFTDLSSGAVQERRAEKKFIRKDGSIVWVRVIAKIARDAEGRPLYLLATAEDIHQRKIAEEHLRESEERYRQLNEELEARVVERTAELVSANSAVRASETRLRESEQRLRQIIDLVPHFIFAKDIEGRFILVNKAVADAYGTTVEDLLGRMDSDFTATEEEVRQFRRDDLAVMQGGVAKVIPEEQITDTAGHVRWLSTIKIPMCVSGTDTPAVLGVATDITRRKRSEEERERLEQQLRCSQKLEAIGTLAGGIAHDFNNILTAVLGYAGMLEARLAGDAAGRDALAQIQTAGQRARELVRQILTFSRQQEQERRVVGLQPLIHEALKLLRAAIPSTIEIVQEIDPTAPPVMADPTQIHQLVMNLAANAAAAIGDKPGRLEVCYGSASADSLPVARPSDFPAGECVRLRVRDNGRGMDDVTLERIFEPFFTTKPAGEGTGLGLSVVHGIVQAHDGMVWVDSKPGKGTTFEVFFPSREVAAVERPAEPGQHGHGNGQTILVLDDEEPIVGLVQALLRGHGYKSVGFTSPLEALAALGAQPQTFDAVVTDYSMPGMNGVDWAAKALQVRPELPIILTTGFSGQMTAEQVRGHGFHCLLPKPFTHGSLAEAVSGALERQVKKAA